MKLEAPSGVTIGYDVPELYSIYYNGYGYWPPAIPLTTPASEKHLNSMSRLSADIKKIMKEFPGLAVLHLCEFGTHGDQVPVIVQDRLKHRDEAIRSHCRRCPRVAKLVNLAPLTAGFMDNWIILDISWYIYNYSGLQAIPWAVPRLCINLGSTPSSRSRLMFSAVSKDYAWLLTYSSLLYKPTIRGWLMPAYTSHDILILGMV